jgi:hypothetical protein
MNMRSTKAKTAPLETCDTSQLYGKKIQDIYTKTYRVRNIMFSNQTGQSVLPKEQELIPEY